MTRRSDPSLRGEAAAAAATTGSRTWCSSPPSLRCETLPSRAFYDRKRAEGKGHNAAVIRLARRRRGVILAVLRSHTPYQAEVPHDQPVAA